MKAQHITLALEGAEPRFEIQLLVFDPMPPDDPGEHPDESAPTGLQPPCVPRRRYHCATSHLVANGVNMLSDEMDYISRKLRFFEGPEGITLELVEWVEANA